MDQADGAGRRRLAQLGHGRSRQARLLQQLADAAGLVGADHHSALRAISPIHAPRRSSAARQQGRGGVAGVGCRRRRATRTRAPRGRPAWPPRRTAAASRVAARPSPASALRRSWAWVSSAAASADSSSSSVSTRCADAGRCSAVVAPASSAAHVSAASARSPCSRRARSACSSLGQVARRALRQRAPAIGGQELAGRQQRDLLQAAPRGLRDRIEAADRLDLVAEQVQPHRFGRAGRPDVDDAAARRELADAADLDRDVVARRHQRAEQRVLVDALPDADLARAARPAARASACAAPAPASGATSTALRGCDASQASARNRSADSSCSGSARSSGMAARSGRTRTLPVGSQAARSSARRWASSSLRATTTMAWPTGRLLRRAARCAARPAGGHRELAGRRQVARQLGGQRRDATVGAATGRRRSRWTRTGGGGHAMGAARSRPLNSFMAASMPSRSHVSTASARGGDRLGGELALPRLEGGQHVVDGHARAAGASDADPQPVELVRAQAGDDVAQPVVAAGRSLAAQPQAAQRQVDVIGHHQQILGGVRAGLAQCRAHRAAGQVHVLHRLHQQHALAPGPTAGPPGGQRRPGPDPVRSGPIGRRAGRPRGIPRCGG